MKHDEIIKQEYISQYFDIHKMLYSTLSIMISDISFLEACVNLQDHRLEYDWISIKYLHRTVFENLIVRTYRCFFDNSGPEATNLLKFKNSILGIFLKEEYRNEIKNQINGAQIENKIYRKVKFEKIKRNVLCLRDKYIGHGIINTDDAEVDLLEIKELLQYGCELFQKLSFEPEYFYNGLEGDGYDFSREFAYTEQSLSNIIKYTMLSSTHIKSISCNIDPECEKPVVESISRIVNDINKTKKVGYVIPDEEKS